MVVVVSGCSAFKRRYPQRRAGRRTRAPLRTGATTASGADWRTGDWLCRSLAAAVASSFLLYGLKCAESIPILTEPHSTVGSIRQPRAAVLPGVSRPCSAHPNSTSRSTWRLGLSVVLAKDVKNCLRRSYAIPEVHEAHARGDALQYGVR